MPWECPRCRAIYPDEEMECNCPAPSSTSSGNTIPGDDGSKIYWVKNETAPVSEVSIPSAWTDEEKRDKFIVAFEGLEQLHTRMVSNMDMLEYVLKNRMRRNEWLVVLAVVTAVASMVITIMVATARIL